LHAPALAFPPAVLYSSRMEDNKPDPAGRAAWLHALNAALLAAFWAFAVLAYGSLPDRRASAWEGPRGGQ
jgi:hypothetical protein